MNEIRYEILQSLNFSECQIDYFKNCFSSDELETQKKWLCTIADLTNILYDCESKIVS